MHDEVFEATQDSGTTSSKDYSATGASSPSEAYANLTLESGDTSGMTDAERTRTASQSDQQNHRPPPRASSPAKRPHSDMDDGKMDVDNPTSARRGSGQSSPRATKPLPAGAPQRSLRASSVEMADAASNGGSAASSETASGSNGDSTATSVSMTQAADAPSLDEQVGKVLAITKQPLQDRQEGYVISEKWLERVFARTSDNIGRPEQFSKSATVGEIGPVDNSDLIDSAIISEDLADQDGEDFVPLRPGQTIGQHFEILPVEAWELVMSWYGLKEGSPVIRRYVHNTSPDKNSQNLQWEVFPPIFTIRKVRKSSQAPQDAAKLSPKLVASRSEKLLEFIQAAKRSANIQLDNKVRTWRVLNAALSDDTLQQPSGMLTPESSPRNSSPVATAHAQRLPLVIDAASFSNLTEGTEREQVTGKDEKANEIFNDQLTLGEAGLGEDQVLILEEQDEKGEYISDSTKIASKNALGNKAAAKTNRGLQSTTNSGRSTPTPSGPMTRGRTRSGKTRGTVGLTNLGNTCYMNSALQCIRSVQELSLYFMKGEYKGDLNADNPLGHGGQIAKSYAGLLASIYDENAVSSFAPKNFKMQLGRAQPMFSGYGQQDSQEFLSFLVDGLHEDLNRIKKKPYTENPESDDKTVHDPEAIKALGEKFRAIHHSRNDSVTMDLFNGFYKNTMVCPECDKVSITFDPYSLLTLQLPIEQTWQHTITYIPLRGRMYKLEVDIDKNATIKALKEYVGQRFGVKWNRLMASEVYSHKFYRHLEDKNTIAESNIGQRDDIYFYELETVPSNWPPPKKKGSRYRTMLFTAASSDEDIPDTASQEHDRIMIPIFHRGPSVSSYRAQNWSVVLNPSFIVLNRDDVKSYDAILKKVFNKVAQLTTRPIFTESSGSSLDHSRSGSDVVLTTEEDASPNGDPRVKDGSINGEDNMVEVTMTESDQTPADQLESDEIPELLRPGTFIPPEFRQLFEMKHTRASKEFVTTGWSTVDHNKTYEPISKRIPVPPTRQSSVQSSEVGSNESSTEDETDDNQQFSADAQSALDAANESSDEDMIPSIEPETDFGRGGRQKHKKKSKKQRKQDRKHRNNKNLKSYPKKGRMLEQPSQSFSDVEADEDGTLIRMGEAIVLEWSPDAYDALFGGINDEDSRGMDASKFIETLEDEELRVKKAKRAARRKNGITLDECFAETSKSEVLSEDNAWYCNRCKEMRRATKTLEIWTAPDILVVHLKRFSAHRSFRDKIEALIDFPVEGLDLSGRVGLPEDKELIYDLFAVDNHYGGLGGGHYTAYAKNFYDQQWYDYNDSIVSKVSDPQRVVTSSAYLLFYRRRSSVPLGGAKLQKIVNEALNLDSEEGEDSDDANSRNPSRSPAGNGSRLGGSSLNGSSSAFGAGAGVGALRGGGSASAGNLARNGVGVVTAEEEMVDPPSYDDEGYADDDDDDDANFASVDINTLYEPLHNHYQDNGASWGFGSVQGQTITNEDDDNVFDDTASNAPNLGSAGGDDLDTRMIEDFGDDLTGSGMRPGMSTPLEGEVAPMLGPEQSDDPPVAEIHVKAD